MPSQNRKIDTICIDGVRGATKSCCIKFDSNKVAIIYGENGTGKSSIVDAIDNVFNKSFGCQEGLTDSENKKYFCSTTNSLKANKTKITLTDKMEYSYSTNENLPVVKVLRRKTMLNYIATTPKSLYDLFKDFLDIEQVENTENSLRELLKSYKKDFGTTSSRLSSKQNELKNIFSEKIGVKSDYEQELKIFVSKPISGTQKTIKEYTDFLSALSKLEEIVKNIDLENKALLSANKEYESVSSLLVASAISTITLLEEAEKVIRTENLETCPVCKQTINKDETLKRIVADLSNLKDIKAKKSQLETIKHQIEKHKTLLEKYKGERLTATTNMPATATVSLTKIKDLTKDSTDEEIFLFLKNVAQEKPIIEKELGTYRNLIEVYHAISIPYSEIKDLNADAIGLEHKIEKINQILPVVEKERKAYVEGIVSQISQSVCQLYDTIHKNERLANIKFVIKPNQRQSMEILSSFYNADDVPPNAYYSESHLDTLGFCIFTALAILQNAEFLVLDDIFTSVDNAHIDRIIDLIENNLRNKFWHIIMTTHYDSIKNRYKYRNSAIQLLELGTWSIEAGISITSRKQAISNLESLLKDATSDKVVIGMQAGRLLEGILRSFAIKYGTLVPMSPENKYTLGILIDSILSMSPDIKIEYNGQVTNIHDKIKYFKSKNWVRNDSGHLNLDSFLSRGDADNFAKDVIQLNNNLLCPDCGKECKKNTGSDYQCKCGKTHMTPVMRA